MGNAKTVGIHIDTILCKRMSFCLLAWACMHNNHCKNYRVDTHMFHNKCIHFGHNSSPFPFFSLQPGVHLKKR